MNYYLMLKACVAGGERRVAGDVIQLPASEGNALISMGRAANTSAPVEKKIEDRAVGLSETSAKPKRRSKKAD